MSNWDNLDGLPAEAYNDQFLQKLGQDPENIRMVGDNFVRDRLREDMVFNEVIPQTPVTRERLQQQLDSDTLYEVIHIDPNARASIVDFRGAGRSQVVRGPRVPLGFHMLKSDEFEVVEQELLVYPYPIVKLVHEYGIKAMGDQHDLYMLQNSQRAVDFVDDAANTAYKAKWGGGTVLGIDPGTGLPVSGTRTTITSQSIVNAKKNMSNRLRPSMMIITQFDHNDLDALEITEQGDVLRSETFISGYRQPTWTGLRMVVTTKQDIFAPGNIWVYSSPDYLGKNRVLDYGGNAYKLFIDRRSNIITWHTYITVGALLANVGSVVKLELHQGAGDVAFDNPLNITDDDLFETRNLVEAQDSAGGLGKFPDIRQF